MSDISVLSRTQRIIVDMASSSVSVINAGPSGPGGPQGLQGEVGPQGLPGVSVVVSETAPASPSLGDVWYETTTTLLWVYDGTQWVNASVNTAFDLTVTNSLVSSELVINSGSITINSGDEQLLIGNDPPNENFGAITAWNTNTEARVDLILEGQDVLVYGNSLQVNDTRVPVSGSIYEIVKLTQAQYDALTPDANTLYVIVG